MVDPIRRQEVHPEFISETGKICAAWALLEAITDRILWGTLSISPNVGAIISGYKDLAGRWGMIVGHAEGKVEAKDLETFRTINKHVQTIAIDRNIAVHGTISVVGVGDSLQKSYAAVTRGVHAGKLNEIDSARMIVIRDNIVLVSKRAQALAEKYHWALGSPPVAPINLDWARPISEFP